MLPATEGYPAAKTFEMKTRLLTLSLVKPRQKGEAILKTYELFIKGDMR
jgi:hypothetical protein